MCVQKNQSFGKTSPAQSHTWFWFSNEATNAILYHAIECDGLQCVHPATLDDLLSGVEMGVSSSRHSEVNFVLAEMFHPCCLGQHLVKDKVPLTVAAAADMHLHTAQHIINSHTKFPTKPAAHV